MTLLELENELKIARNNGCDDHTAIAVGSKHSHIDVDKIVVALYEPRNETGHRITSVRKIFIS
jgi:hypothetical protein